jgi:hypothetical protein
MLVISGTYSHEDDAGVELPGRPLIIPAAPASASEIDHSSKTSISQNYGKVKTFLVLSNGIYSHQVILRTLTERC